MQMAHDDMYHLVGRRQYSGQQIRIRSTRYMTNFAASAGGGAIIVAHNHVTHMFDRIGRYGCWSFLMMHEMGHFFESGASWTFIHTRPGTQEFAANLMVAYVMCRRNATIRHWTRDQYRTITGIATYRHNFYAWAHGGYRDVFVYDIWNRDAYSHRFSEDALLYTFLSIQAQIGWEPFRQTFRYFNNLGGATPGTPIDRVNLFLTRLRDFSGGRDVIGMMNPFSRFYYGLRFGGSGWAIRYV